jgi:hypothetical protein
MRQSGLVSDIINGIAEEEKTIAVIENEPESLAETLEEAEATEEQVVDAEQRGRYCHCFGHRWAGDTQKR